MARQVNPAYEAYLSARASNLYSKQELDDMLKGLELDTTTMAPTREMGSEGNKNPVATLITVNDEELAPTHGGILEGIQTDKQHEVVERGKQIATEWEANRGNKK